MTHAIRASTLSCPHRPPCPGCPRLDASGWPEPARTLLGGLAARAGIATPRLVEGPRFGWRHRARLAVRGRAGSPKIGLFQAGTHRIVDTPRCGVHHPLVNRVADATRAAIRATGTEPYREATHAGVLRYLQVVVERGSGRAQVVLVCRSETAREVGPLVLHLRRELGDSLHSLWWNGNTSRHNAILGEAFERISGPESVCERIAGVDVFYPPGAFGQANLPLADRIVDRVVAAVADARRVVDLYAGSGAFGLPLLARGAEVHFAERSPHSLDGLRAGIAARPAHERVRARVHAGDASLVDTLRSVLEAADAVVLDPPRRGAASELIDHLAATPPPRLIYVSCDPASLARQAERLLDGGRLSLVELDAYALFPNTDHVETVAHFARRP